MRQPGDWQNRGQSSTGWAKTASSFIWGDVVDTTHVKNTVLPKMRWSCVVAESAPYLNMLKEEDWGPSVSDIEWEWAD